MLLFKLLIVNSPYYRGKRDELAGATKPDALLFRALWYFCFFKKATKNPITKYWLKKTSKISNSVESELNSKFFENSPLLIRDPLMDSLEWAEL